MNTYYLREHENQGFCANAAFELQKAYRSHCFMKTWNDPIVIADMLTRRFPQNHNRSSVFDKNIDIHVSSKTVNSRNYKNASGREISVTRLQYLVRLAVRVCMLPISAHKTSKLYQNWWTESEKLQKSIKSVKSIETIEFWSSAAEATAFKLLHQGEDEDRLTNCFIKNANKIIHVFTISNKS